MTVFLHARIHSSRLHQLQDARPVVIRCPSCGDAWFTDLPDAPRPLIWQDALARALTLLRHECPDHAHRFEVTP